MLVTSSVKNNFIHQERVFHANRGPESSSSYAPYPYNVEWTHNLREQHQDPPIEEMADKVEANNSRLHGREDVGSIRIPFMLAMHVEKELLLESKKGYPHRRGSHCSNHYRVLVIVITLGLFYCLCMHFFLKWL